MSTIAMKPCTCRSTYQDEAYGRGNRLHNRAKGEGTEPAWRCTVCAPPKVKASRRPMKAVA